MIEMGESGRRGRLNGALRQRDIESVSPPDAVSLPVLPGLFVLCLTLSFPYPLSLTFYVSPGEPQIGHLITHDPLGNTMAGK